MIISGVSAFQSPLTPSSPLVIYPWYLSYLMSVFNAPSTMSAATTMTIMPRIPDGGENIHGKVVYFKGLTIIGFEGSMFYHHPSAIQYTERQMRSIWRRMAWRFRFGRKIDIVLTHAPPLASMTPKTSATGFSHLLPHHSQVQTTLFHPRPHPSQLRTEAKPH